MNHNEESSSSSPPQSSSTTSSLFYSKWSNCLDDLINDEIGRKLFSYFLKTTFSNDHCLMLYMIFKCLPECTNEDQLKKMLKCTYNTYFKSSNQLLSMILNDSYANLCFKLENKEFDLDLILEAKKSIKKFLENKCYNEFLKSNIYVKCIKLLQNDNFLNIFSSFNNLDEQVNLLIDVCLNDTKFYFYSQQQAISTIKSPSKSYKSLIHHKSTPNINKKNRIPFDLSLVNSSKKLVIFFINFIYLNV
jgi:hypothetical protein